jgi:hypothetical protein
MSNRVARARLGAVACDSGCWSASSNRTSGDNRPDRQPLAPRASLDADPGPPGTPVAGAALDAVTGRLSLPSRDPFISPIVGHALACQAAVQRRTAGIVDPLRIRTSGHGAYLRLDASAAGTRD